MEKSLQTISKKYGLIFVILFGSHARNQQPNEESDRDIAVLMKQQPDAKIFGELFSALSDFFPRDTIDLRFLNGADEPFRFNVVKDGILLAGDTKDYQAYKLSIIKRYIDDKQKYDPFQERLLEKNQQFLEGNL